MRTLILAGVVCVMVACSGDDSSSTGKTNPSDAGNGDATSGGSAGTSTGGSAGASTGGSAGTLGDAGSKWDTYCQQQSAHWTSCGKSGFECIPSSCVYSIYDANVVDEYASCLLAQSCGELGSDDECFGGAGKVNGQYPPANQTNIDACVAKYTSCGGSSGPLSFDWCAIFLPIVLPTISEQASLCLDKPCAEIAACVTALETKFDCLDG